MVGDLIDEHIRDVRDDNSVVRGRVHVNGVRANAAKANHDALFQFFDYVAGDFGALVR